MADDQVATVKQANDIVEVIGEYVALRKRGRTYKGLCPFHDDHSPSMDVDPTRQRYRCWACGKFGDVLTFIMERERVEFPEALEMLARRAGITLKRSGGPDPRHRLQMYDLMKWAEERYHRYLREAPAAESARAYLQERRLTPETISHYGLGYAPDSWTWLAQAARRAGWADELLIEVGLCAPRESDHTCYDRFRDRVMFPIRDVRGRTVGFGGRVLPSSSSSASAAKYYNSSDTPLFTKSEHLYGLDQARAAGEKEGYLAVVEGYTDVLMAHQMGVLQVVATLGTALNVRHIVQLRRFVPRVVLVFDADAGGERGVDQALELFVSQEVDLAIATLPRGLDPCDLLVQQGADAFRAVLDGAVDALEFKLTRALAADAQMGVSGQARAVDSVLQVLAAAPEPAGSTLVKHDLILTRLAQRTGVPLDAVWSRYRALRQEKRPGTRPARDGGEPVRQAPADPAERQLIEVLLGEPALIERAQAAVSPAEVQHPGLKRVLTELYQLHAEGQLPDLDSVRARLADRPALAASLVRLEANGQGIKERATCLEQLLEVFQQRRVAPEVEELRGRLQSIPSSEPVPVELFRQLQEKLQAKRPATKPGPDD